MRNCYSFDNFRTITNEPITLLPGVFRLPFVHLHRHLGLQRQDIHGFHSCGDLLESRNKKNKMIIVSRTFLVNC